MTPVLVGRAIRGGALCRSRTRRPQRPIRGRAIGSGARPRSISRAGALCRCRRSHPSRACCRCAASRRSNSPSSATPPAILRGFVRTGAGRTGVRRVSHRCAARVFQYRFAARTGRPARGSRAAARGEHRRTRARLCEQQLGITPTSDLADALSALTEYFRAFEESAQPPPDTRRHLSRSRRAAKRASAAIARTRSS